MKFLTDFAYRHLHGFPRFPGDSTALVYIYICCFMVMGRGLSCKPITVGLVLYSNFKIFVTIVRGLSETNYIAQLHSLTPEHPLGYLVKNQGRISCTSPVMANFLLKFPNFHYHGSRGRLSKVRMTVLN